MEQNRYLSWCCHESATDTAEQVGVMMEKNQREVIVMSRSEFVEYLQVNVRVSRENTICSVFPSIEPNQRSNKNGILFKMW